MSHYAICNQYASRIKGSFKPINLPIISHSWRDISRIHSRIQSASLATGVVAMVDDRSVGRLCNLLQGADTRFRIVAAARSSKQYPLAEFQ